MHIHASVQSNSTPTATIVDDVGGKNAEEIPLKPSPSTSGSKQAKHDLPKHISDQHVSTAQKTPNHYYPVAQPLLPPCHYRQPTSHLSPTSAATHSAPANHIPQPVPLAVSTAHASKGVCKFRGQTSSSATELRSTSTGSPRGIHAMKVKPSTYVVNNSNIEAVINPCSTVLVPDQHDTLEGENYDVPMQGNSSQHGEGVLHNKSLSTDNQVYLENHPSKKQESTEEGSNSYQPPTVTVAVQGLPSRHSVDTQSKIASRARRAKITERLKALQELLPHSGEAKREAIMDDIIDYIKYLQLELKVLSQSRLGGEAATDPFIHFEGFGHYLFHDQMLREPLEEVIGQLMGINMSAVTQLLESKGLSVMPISLAEGFSQTW